MPTISNNNESTTFTFRSKFEKLVSDENRPVIMSAFEKFCNIDPETTAARDILWNLTYNPAVSLKDLGLNLEIISLENVSKLRDELRHQYEKLHKGYLTVEVSEECISAFDALSKKAGPIVASVVNELCSYRMFGSDVPHTLFLLSSDKENFFFGGIREVGFDYKEAEYLKPFHIEIHALLKAMYDHNQEASKNTPFSGLDSMIKGAGIELPFYMKEVPAQAPVEPMVETPVEATADIAVHSTVEAQVESPKEVQTAQPNEENSGFKPLTPEGILEHKDVFTTFVENSDMNILLQIGEFGFDLNKVIAKKDAIRKVLEANAKKEESDKLLQKVEALKDEAKTIMFEATEALNT